MIPAEHLRERLVDWYRRNARDLPWRKDVTPYRVLLSELMLQQTRVDTVIPYFERFTERWPTLEDMAAASEDEVLSMWAGLGYYRRARFLHRAVVAAHGLGGLPGTASELAELPGIGPYTSGAIASIAFGRPAAAVDGNVERVLCRVDGRHEDPRSTPGKKALRARALEISAEGVASEVTQGLMELGATVCTPKRPSCDVCPWGDGCVSRAAGDAETLPKIVRKTKVKAISGVAGVWHRDGRVLLGRRPPGLLGGLWEPVMGERADDEDPVRALTRVFRARAGVQLRDLTWIGRVKHVFTHRRLTLDVYHVVADGEPVPGGEAPYEALAWGRDDEARPLSKLARKVLDVEPPAQPVLFAADTK